jgi:hypothetical protein
MRKTGRILTCRRDKECHPPRSILEGSEAHPQYPVVIRLQGHQVSLPDGIMSEKQQGVHVCRTNSARPIS